MVTVKVGAWDVELWRTANGVRVLIPSQPFGVTTDATDAEAILLAEKLTKLVKQEKEDV